MLFDHAVICAAWQSLLVGSANQDQRENNRLTPHYEGYRRNYEGFAFVTTKLYDQYSDVAGFSTF